MEAARPVASVLSHGQGASVGSSLKTSRNQKKEEDEEAEAAPGPASGLGLVLDSVGPNMGLWLKPNK
jgi:hypothetical protein